LPKKFSNGFTLIETIVGIGVFAILMAGVLGVFAVLSRSTKIARQEVILSSLAANRLELTRNLPYSQVGTLNGNPPGSLPDQPNAAIYTLEGLVFQVYYEVTYVDDPADGTILAGTDSSPNDYKQVKMFVKNQATGKVRAFLTTVSPKGLESGTNAGALLVKVINSVGQPVSGASVHIENQNLSPPLILNRLTDSSGQWLEVSLPASVNGYHLVVTKTGYSTDQTFPITPQNPNPIKPDATVVAGQVTSLTFVIDSWANLIIRTLSLTCQGINGVGVNVRGEKLIGTNPAVYKFNQNYSSVSGQISLANIEWDTYVPTLLSGQGYMVYGTSPIQKVTVLPGASETFSLILGPATTNSLLVIVKDAATGVALEGALVHLRKGGSEPQDYYGITGGSVWHQNDWTGGSGQANYGDPTKYYVDDGNIDVVSVPTGIRLRKTSGRYALSGELVSSSFDTGAGSNFTTLTWEPTSQNPATALEFQIATNNDNQTWNFKGPDGTGGSRYTVSGSSIHPSHDGDRYVRYKVFLSTADDKYTPILTSLSVNYVSGCSTPGQTSFPDLTAGNNYDLEVSLAGYETLTLNNLNIFGNQTLEVLLSP
jgi:prepilin-type N-terminal cleavage/methylation domain-containing protein